MEHVRTYLRLNTSLYANIDEHSIIKPCRRLVYTQYHAQITKNSCFLLLKWKGSCWRSGWLHDVLAISKQIKGLDGWYYEKYCQ